MPGCTGITSTARRADASERQGHLPDHPRRHEPYVRGPADDQVSEVALTGYVYQPPTAQARAGLLLGSPGGRLLLADCLGYAFSDALREQPDGAAATVRAIV